MGKTKSYNDYFRIIIQNKYMNGADCRYCDAAQQDAGII